MHGHGSSDPHGKWGRRGCDGCPVVLRGTWAAARALAPMYLRPSVSRSLSSLEGQSSVCRYKAVGKTKQNKTHGVFEKQSGLQAGWSGGSLQQGRKPGQKVTDTCLLPTVFAPGSSVKRELLRGWNRIREPAGMRSRLSCRAPGKPRTSQPDGSGREHPRSRQLSRARVGGLRGALRSSWRWRWRQLLPLAAGQEVGFQGLVLVGENTDGTFHGDAGLWL